MIVSFQMNTSVDKQKAEEIFEFPIKFWCFFLCLGKTDVEFAFGVGKWEGKNVGGLVEIAIREIEALNVVCGNKSPGKIVVFSQDFIFYFFKFSSAIHETD